MGTSGVENKIPWVGSRGLQLSRNGSDHPDPVRPAISDPPVNRPALFIPKQFKPPLPPSRTDKARPPHVYYSRYAYEPRYDSEREPCARAHTLRGVNVSTSRHQNKPRHQKYQNLRVLRWSYVSFVYVLANNRHNVYGVGWWFSWQARPLASMSIKK